MKTEITRSTFIAALTCQILLTAGIAAPGLAKDSNSCVPDWMGPETPEICNWVSETPLSKGLAYPAGAVSGNTLYIIGGYFQDEKGAIKYASEVLTADAQKDTGRLTKWDVAGSIHTGRSGAAAATSATCLVVAGGSWSSGSNFVYGADVQTAPLNSRVNRLNFSTSPNTLNVPRSNFSLLVNETAAGTRLYAIAGVTQIGRDTVHLDTLEYASLDEECNVGPWRIMNFDLKGGRSAPQAFIHNSKIYVVGGWGDLDLIDIYSDTQFAHLREDGSISPWRTSPLRLPSGIYGHGLALSLAHDKTAMITSFGGQPSTGIYSSTVTFAYFTRADTIGHWAHYFVPMPQPRAGHAALAVADRVYLVGGVKRGGEYINEVDATRVKAGKPH